MTAPQLQTRLKPISAPIIAAETPHKNTDFHVRNYIPLFMLLAAGVALRFFLLAKGVPTLDSDEATFGLMALHMAHGQFSVFMWGQNYMGPLEPLISLPYLLIFGPSALSLRLGPITLYCAAIIGIYLFCQKYFSLRIAIYTALALTFASPFFTIVGMREFGGYVDTMLLGPVILFLALGDLQSRRRLIAMGLLAGFAFWINMLSAPFIVVAILLYAVQRRKRIFHAASLLFAGAMVIGALPALFTYAGDLAQIRHGGAATASTAQNYSSAVQSSQGIVSLFISQITHMAQTFVISLPIVFGFGIGGLQSNGYTPSAFWADAARRPWSYAISVILAALFLALFIGSAKYIWDRRALLLANINPHNEAHAAQSALQAEAALLLVGIFYLIAFIIGQRDLAATPRYLFPLIAVIPAALAQLDRMAGRFAEYLRLHRKTTFGAIKLNAMQWSIMGLLLLPILLINIAGSLTVTPQDTAAFEKGHWVYGSDQALLTALYQDNIHTVISNDYWEGMRLTFESSEKIIVVMITPIETLGYNRYAPYVKAGLSDPRPAYVDYINTQDSRALLKKYTTGNLPGYSIQVIGQFLVALPPIH